MPHDVHNDCNDVLWAFFACHLYFSAMVSSKKEKPASVAPHWSIPLLGSKIFTKDHPEGVSTSAVLTGKKLVALYFSASWCPPCVSFTPKLIEFYHNCQKHHNDALDIVFVSSDRDEQTFRTYYAKMPWLAAIPAFSNSESRERQMKLADMFKIQGIPTLIVLDGRNGHFVTDTARMDILQASSNQDSYMALLESWKSKEAVPIEEAVLGNAVTQRGWLQTVLLFFVRNPIYIIGMLYFVKQCLKYLEGLGKDAGMDKEKTEL